MPKSKYINQTELAAFCNCKQPYIAKLKKRGLFDGELDNGKFLRSKTTRYAKIIEDNRDETREPQRQANNIRKGEEETSKPSTRSKLEENNFIFDVSYLGDAAQAELDALIETGKSSVQKIQIKDAFIDSKAKEIEFKKELGVLIELEEAEALIELIASNMKTKMYNVAHLVKSRFPKTTVDQVDYIYTLIDDAFTEFHKYGIKEDE